MHKDITDAKLAEVKMADLLHEGELLITVILFIHFIFSLIHIFNLYKTLYISLETIA